MTATLSSTPARRTIRRKTRSRRHSRQPPAGAHHGAGEARDQRLARYTDTSGSARELIARGGAGGSVLVVDRDCATHADCLLVAHLAADEPAENAALVCAHYLADLAARACRCRSLTPEDREVVPFAEPHPHEHASAGEAGEDEPLVDRLAFRYALERVHGGMAIPQLRWCRRGPASEPGPATPVSMREAVGALESYEPVRTRTLLALSASGCSQELSTTVLRAELARVQESPIVLNRRLREVVLAAVARQELSMSEIAIRCGRVKRDRNGSVSGETSWLARRIGLLAEGGQRRPTPWIHSDVLALIARRGLGIGPREVEL